MVCMVQQNLLSYSQDGPCLDPQQKGPLSVSCRPVANLHLARRSRASCDVLHLLFDTLRIKHARSECHLP